MAERRLALVVVIVTAALSAWTGALPAPAQACESNQATDFGVSPGCFDLQLSGPPTGADAAPDFVQAGGHPYEMTVTANINAPAAPDPVYGSFWPPGSLRDLSFSFPPGYAADPAAAAPCTLAELADTTEALEAAGCSPASQVGVARVDVAFLGEIISVSGIPFYNLSAGLGGVPRFGFTILSTTVVLDAGLRTGPESGMSIGMSRINQGMILDGATVTFWGVPADPRHTPLRACSQQSLPPEGPSCAAGVPPRALLRVPTSCGAPPVATAEVDSWEHPGDFVRVSVANHLAPGLLGDPKEPGSYPLERPGLDSSQWGPPQGFTGCEELPFHPSIGIASASHEAGAATGLDLDVSFPQEGLADGEAVGESDMRSARIGLPAGMSINPSMANGLQACSAEQAGLGEDSPARCPDASKLGTVEIRTPLLSNELLGAIFLARPEPGPISALPVYLVAEAGVVVKIRAEVRLDSANGRMEAVFAETPQVPLDLLRLHFFGGSRAPFVNPSSCGTAALSGHFTPWSGSPAVDVGTALQVDSGLGGGPCPRPGSRPFAPTLRAGASDPRAGRPSPFSLTIGRADGEQQLESFAVTLPPGLVASLGHVPRCSSQAIAAATGRSGAEEQASPSCPVASRVGSLGVMLGAGDQPLSLDTGRLYLAGRYAGAAFSLVAIAPALAGPLDLGTLVLQMPLEQGRRDGRVRVDASLPSLQRGLRLNLRRISLNLDRPRFVLNPTGCAGTAIEARFTGDEGARASASAPFFLRGCDALGFEPSLRMKALGGPQATHHGAHPGVRATIAIRKHGGANLRRAALVMPLAEQLDPGHLRSICTVPESKSPRECPRNTIYGHATLRTPILDEPLHGPVYIRASDHRFPDLVATLSGPIQLDLSGRMAFGHGRVRIVFDDIPDVPLSQLSLHMTGGRRGILVNNRDLCAARPFARATLGAHNGASKALSSPFAVSCG